MFINKINWLFVRKRLLITIFIDIFLYFFLSSITLNSYIGKLKFPYIIFLFFWIFVSYLLGRYYDFTEKASSNILGHLVKTFLLYIICSSALFFSKIINIEELINILSSNFLIKFCLSSFIIEYLINLVFIFLDTKIKKNWYYLKVDNNLETLEIINSSSYLISRNNLNLRVLDISEILNVDNIQNIDFKGLIIDDFSNLPGNLKPILLDMKLRGLELIKPIDWCEKYLNNIPSEFISNEYLLDKRFLKITGSFQHRLKRLMECLFSFFLLLSCLPILLLAAIFIKLNDGGPIFYSQIRNGFSGKNFRIWKLRSMKINAERNGAQWSSKNDKRITKIGQFLRSTRIDEIPQLFNVIKGDMSLIGPRPERPEIDEILEKSNSNYKLRYMIKPGLSGWAQVNYPYGASQKDSFIKLSFDLYYIKNFSTLLDLIILFKTIKLITNRKGFLPN